MRLVASFACWSSAAQPAVMPPMATPATAAAPMASLAATAVGTARVSWPTSERVVPPAPGLSTLRMVFTPITLPNDGFTPIGAISDILLQRA